MDVLQWSRHHRLFPGQGAFDLPAFLGHVLAAGYAGPLSLEVFNDVFRQADPRRAAVDALRSLLALTRRSDRPAADVRARSRARHGGAGRPTPRLHGFAFAELAVDDECGAAVARAARRARLRPRRHAPHQAGAAVAAGRGAGAAQRQPRPTARTAPPSRRSASRAPTRRPPRSGRGAARAGAPPHPRPGRGGPARPSPRRTARRCSSAARGAEDALAGRLPARRSADAREAIGHGRPHRPRRAHPAVRQLRRGGAVLPQRARPARPSTRPRSPPRSAWCAAGRSPTAAGPLRARPDACRCCAAATGRRAWPSPSTSRSPATTCSRSPARARAPARRCCRSRTTTTTTSTPGSPRRRSSSPTMRELGVLYDRDAARRVPALLHRGAGRAGVLRGRAADRRLRRATARSTPRSGWRRTGGRGSWADRARGRARARVRPRASVGPPRGRAGRRAAPSAHGSRVAARALVGRPVGRTRALRRGSAAPKPRASSNVMIRCPRFLENDERADPRVDGAEPVAPADQVQHVDERPTSM